MGQDRIFYSGEGDRWYSRNRNVLVERNIDDDPALIFLNRSKIKFDKVLEVGASNGFRLDMLRQDGCECTAVEPSKQAIEEGKKLYPDITFLRGTASAIPMEKSGSFDLVIVHYVLHWVARDMLLRSVAEIDRMVADGGYLLIGDFFPPGPQRVSYHHLPGKDVWTYKQDYTHLFLSTSIYGMIDFATVSFKTHRLSADAVGDDRCFIALLRKNLSAGYQTVQLSS